MTLPKHTEEKTKEIFDTCFRYYKKEVSQPLSFRKLNKKLSYHPHRSFSESNIVRSRIRTFMKLGSVAEEYMSKLGGMETIWCQSLESAKLKNTVAAGESVKRHNLYQTKFNFTGKPFPTSYSWDDHGSPRFLAQPAHTVRDADKKFTQEIFVNVFSHAKVYLYDCDLSSCHARVIMLFGSKDNALLLYKSFQEKDLYMDIAKAIQDKHEISRKISTKTLRKIVKIKSLAMLNGGGLSTPNHITGLVSVDLTEKNTRI